MDSDDYDRRSESSAGKQAQSVGLEWFGGEGDFDEFDEMSSHHH